MGHISEDAGLRLDDLQDLRAHYPHDNAEQELCFDALSTSVDIISSLQHPGQFPKAAHPDVNMECELWFDAVPSPTDILFLQHPGQEDEHDHLEATHPDDNAEGLWFDAVATPADISSLVEDGDDTEVWYDTTESVTSVNQRAWESMGPKEGSQPGEPPLTSFSFFDAPASPVGKLSNMTGSELGCHLRSVLEKGPKFAITRKVTAKTLNEVEVGIERAMYALRCKTEIEQKRTILPPHGVNTNSLKPRFADNDAAVPRLAPAEIERTMGKLKRKLIGLYKNQRDVKPNVVPEEEEAITRLSKDENIIVKPSDKCKGLVIMTKEMHVDKSLDILGTYEQVPTNPTPKVEAATKRIVKSVMGQTSHLFNLCCPKAQGQRSSMVSQKNHKESVPLRPIVSACGGPLDKVTWFLEQILCQLIKYVPAHLPNTDTYLERLKQRYSGRFPPGTIVFSLDVTNLYGNIRVPTDEAVQTVMNLLQEHRDSINLFGLSWTDVEPLLNHCLSNSYLRFGHTYYKQNLGLPMGSRVAPSVAIIFMGALEEIFLSSDRAQPDMYTRSIMNVSRPPRGATVAFRLLGESAPRRPVAWDGLAC